MGNTKIPTKRNNRLHDPTNLEETYTDFLDKNILSAGVDYQNDAQQNHPACSKGFRVFSRHGTKTI